MSKKELHEKHGRHDCKQKLSRRDYRRNVIQTIKKYQPSHKILQKRKNNNVQIATL